jgi:hypothetical protein
MIIESALNAEIYEYGIVESGALAAARSASAPARTGAVRAAVSRSANVIAIKGL